jgi:hypothetical protein
VRAEPDLKPRKLIEFHPDVGYTRKESLDHNVRLSLLRTLPVARHVRREDYKLMEEDLQERVAAIEDANIACPDIRCRVELLYWPVEVGRVKIATRVSISDCNLSKMVTN